MVRYFFGLLRFNRTTACVGRSAVVLQRDFFNFPMVFRYFFRITRRTMAANRVAICPCVVQFCNVYLRMNDGNFLRFFLLLRDVAWLLVGLQLYTRETIRLLCFLV